MVQAVVELGRRCLLSARVVRRFVRRVLRDRGDRPLPIVFQVRCDGRLQAVPREGGLIYFAFREPRRPELLRGRFKAAARRRAQRSQLLAELCNRADFESTYIVNSLQARLRDVVRGAVIRLDEAALLGDIHARLDRLVQ